LPGPDEPALFYLEGLIIIQMAVSAIQQIQEITGGGVILSGEPVSSGVRIICRFLPGFNGIDKRHTVA
jgi:hypothetical protein